MATSTIKSINAGIDVPYDLPTSSSSWTESSGKYVHIYTDNRITQGCRVEVTFKTGALNTELPYIEFEKNTGSVNFTISSIPTIVVPIIIHIINAQTGNVQAVRATDVETVGSAQDLGANVNSSLISLNDQIANIKLFPDPTNILYDKHGGGVTLNYTATEDCYICAWTLDRAAVSFKLNDVTIVTTSNAALEPTGYSGACSMFLKTGDTFKSTGAARCIVMGLR